MLSKHSKRSHWQFKFASGGECSVPGRGFWSIGFEECFGSTNELMFQLHKFLERSTSEIKFK